MGEQGFIAYDVRLAGGIAQPSLVSRCEGHDFLNDERVFVGGIILGHMSPCGAASLVNGMGRPTGTNDHTHTHTHSHPWVIGMGSDGYG